MIPANTVVALLTVTLEAFGKKKTTLPDLTPFKIVWLSAQSKLPVTRNTKTLLAAPFRVNLLVLKLQFVTSKTFMVPVAVRLRLLETFPRDPLEESPAK